MCVLCKWTIIIVVVIIIIIIIINIKLEPFNWQLYLAMYM